VKVGDLVRILRSGAIGIVVDFDADDDPIVGGCIQRPPNATDMSPEPEWRYSVEVISESR